MLVCNGEMLSKLRRPVKISSGLGKVWATLNTVQIEQVGVHVGGTKPALLAKREEKGRERERYVWAKVIMEKATGARNVKWKWARIHQKRKGTFFGQGLVGWPVITVLTGTGT